MTVRGPSGCRVDDGCITCGDVAVEMTVVATSAADAECVDGDGRHETVATDLVGPVSVGDRVLVHARVALARSDPFDHGGGRSR